jgi:hypothetical protein
MHTFKSSIVHPPSITQPSTQKSSHSKNNAMSLLFRGTPSIIARGQLRSLSTSSHLVLSNACEESGVAILTMNRPPANSLSLEMQV